MLRNLLFCASTSTILAIVLPIVALIAGVAGGIIVSMVMQKKKLGDAKQSANKIIEEAYNKAKEVQSQAKNSQKEAILEAKEEIQQLKAELDRELKERRNEVQRSEQRISQREDALDRKSVV